MSKSPCLDTCSESQTKATVIDMEPKTRKVREFQAAEPYPLFLADYQEISGGKAWDMERKMLKVRRTEICDRSHEEIMFGRLILPRRCEEVEIFAKECSNLVKGVCKASKKEFKGTLGNGFHFSVQQGCSKKKRSYEMVSITP